MSSASPASGWYDFSEIGCFRDREMLMFVNVGRKISRPTLGSRSLRVVPQNGSTSLCVSGSDPLHMEESADSILVLGLNLGR